MSRGEVFDIFRLSTARRGTSATLFDALPTVKTLPEYDRSATLHKICDLCAGQESTLPDVFAASRPRL